MCFVEDGPLVCPDCGAAMRIVAFIEEQRVVRAILVHLSLWDEALQPARPFPGRLVRLNVSREPSRLFARVALPGHRACGGPSAAGPRWRSVS